MPHLPRILGRSCRDHEESGKFFSGELHVAKSSLADGVEVVLAVMPITGLATWGNPPAQWALHAIFSSVENSATASAQGAA